MKNDKTQINKDEKNKNILDLLEKYNISLVEFENQVQLFEKQKKVEGNEKINFNPNSIRSPRPKLS